LRIAVAEILPVPHMSDCVLGVYNWRGNLLWMVDLNHLVGFPSLVHDFQTQSVPNAMVIAIEVEQQPLGLVVPRIDDIEWHEAPNMQPPSAGLFPSQLLPFVQGYLSEASSMVLSVEAIAQSPLLQAL
jgi:positive phototaxis protein PixI